MNTTTYQFVTDNSVYEVLDHSHSPGVSARSRTKSGKLGGDFTFAGSANVGMYFGVLCLFVYDENGRQVLRTSPIQSICRITSESVYDRSSYKPVARSEWDSIRLAGRQFGRSPISGLDRSRTRSLV